MQSDFSQQIKEKALQIGFSACGITNAHALPLEKETAFRQWLQHGFHADMHFLQRNMDKRMNPELLFEGTKRIIVLLLNYHNPAYSNLAKSSYKVAQYALGIDYHLVIKEKLQQLADFIQQHYPNEKQRYFVDTAPVLEKHLASKAGLGTVGKNTLLLTAKGSYYFIGEIFTTLSLRCDAPLTENPCLHCDKCLHACPTQALTPTHPYCLHASQCISYNTIEYKNKIPSEIIAKMETQLYGCDICQQVCPCNQQAEPTETAAFTIKKELLEWDDLQWENLSPADFKHVFSDSVLGRIGYEKLNETRIDIAASKLK
jgi:epoxyqueuosine reductase